MYMESGEKPKHFLIKKKIIKKKPKKATRP